jgi:hypothetical protein
MSTAYQDVRTKAIVALGGRCVKCGYDADSRALELDHINGGGGREYREGGGFSGYYRRLKLVAEGERGGEIQLLCANCNRIKDAERRGIQRLTR